MQTPPRVSIIAAIGAHNRAVGKGNQLLWHISDDLKRFKQLTVGHPVILGRKTFESIVGYLGGPLPGRPNIVVTRNSNYSADKNVVIAHSVPEALEKARELDQKEIFIGGGPMIWQSALPHTDLLYLTLIDEKKDGDAYFPKYEHLFTKELDRECHTTKDGLSYCWVTLEKEQ